MCWNIQPFPALSFSRARSSLRGHNLMSPVLYYSWEQYITFFLHSFTDHKLKLLYITLFPLYIETLMEILFDSSLLMKSIYGPHTKKPEPRDPTHRGSDILPLTNLASAFNESDKRMTTGRRLSLSRSAPSGYNQTQGEIRYRAMLHDVLFCMY